MDKLRGARYYFTKLDIQWGYNNITFLNSIINIACCDDISNTAKKAEEQLAPHHGEPHKSFPDIFNAAHTGLGPIVVSLGQCSLIFLNVSLH